MSEKRKLAISGSLLAFAVICFLIDVSVDRAWCLMGMVLSFGGDLLLLDFDFIRKKISAYFQAGATCFGIAHICYALAYMRLIKAIGADGSGNAGTILAICIMAGLLVYFIQYCLRRKKYVYLPIVIFYILFIGAEFVTVFTYAYTVFTKAEYMPSSAFEVWSVFGIWQEYGIWSALGSLLGAIAFIISDFCLGASRIAGVKHLGRWIWVFYPVGQFLLILCG